MHGAFTLAAMGLVAAAQPAPEMFSGNHWYRVCLGMDQDIPGDTGRMYCHGFVGGVDATNATLPQPYFCGQAGTNLAQLTRIAVKYLLDHPAELHQDFGTLVLRSLVDAFPCQDSDPHLPRP
jgi:Rap1a immunity proteins